MRWECSECGEIVSSVRPPDVCSRCGLAVGVFVLADEGDGDVSWTRLADATYDAVVRSALGAEHM